MPKKTAEPKTACEDEKDYKKRKEAAKRKEKNRFKRLLEADGGATTGQTGATTTSGTSGLTGATETTGGMTDGGTSGGTTGSGLRGPGGMPTKRPDDATKALFAMIGRLLTQHEWYHGIMPRGEVEDMLLNDGDFLVRKTTLKRQLKFCLSIKTGKIVKHLPLDYTRGEWSLVPEQKFPNLEEMITSYMKSGKKVGETGVTLRKPINRPDYYLLHENITVDKRIGGGAFGDVHIGTVRLKDGKETKAAVKKIKGKVKKNQIDEFVREAKLMRRFTHPNIVKMYGVAPQEEPLMIVLELAANGCMRKHLKKHPHPENITQDELMGYARDAARGMSYLSAMSVIHRDLAARNCLLGEKMEVKISDFGLSVADKAEVRMEKLKSVPIKWLSPETINEGVFTTKTDVWSFGVLLWEIFSKCKSDPFPKETNAVAKDKILGDKPPMDAPNGAPDVIKSTMMACFIKNPQSRIDFAGVLRKLSPDETPPTADAKTCRVTGSTTA